MESVECLDKRNKSMVFDVYQNILNQFLEMMAMITYFLTT